MKKIFTLMFALLAACTAMAEDVTFDFSSDVAKGWTSTAKPNGTDADRGTQFIANTALTLEGVKDVTKVVITCSCNIDEGNSIAVAVGGTTWGTEALIKETNVEKTFTGSAASGTLTINITRSSKSVYIKKVVVTGTVEGGQTGGDGDSDKLDPTYEYDEPTTVEVNHETCSNSAYSFVSNNVLVECSTGACNETYFGCNAGKTITFTATQPIKGIVINGFIKQYFSATSNYGDIMYADADDSEEGVTSESVVVLTDVDSKTVTISCVKQLRCYSVDFYFEENPEVTPGGDEEEATYDWEPTEVSTINETMTYADYTDYEPLIGLELTDLYFENDENVLDFWVWAPAVSGTGIAPGTYTIDNSGEPGTVMASMGGTDEEDYPSYLARYSYDEEQEEYSYICAYYLMSGTLTVEATEGGAKVTVDAKSYYGSTIKATYEGPIYAYGDDLEGISATALTPATEASKQLKNGHIVIRHSGHTYDLMGKQLR